MSVYFVNTPGIVKLFFRKWIWNYRRSEKNLYLTFDDGPTEGITTWVLDELDKYDAKATFFCIGKNVVANKSIYDDIRSRGHSIGNHTHNHLNGWKTKTVTYLDNIIKAGKVLKGAQPMFRPPYGKMTLAQSRKIRERALKIIGWDVLSADFDYSISAEKCLENVIRNSKNGSIVVFHDSLKAEEKVRHVLPKVLDYYRAKGYAFKKIEVSN